MIDRNRFFTTIRPTAFGNKMTQGQVDGCNAILDQWEIRKPNGDIRWLAYMFATTKWETAHTMHPIEEYGHGAGRPYGVPDPVTGHVYYGRGYVQLTWKANYQTMSGPTGVDLVNHPELALDPKVAADIMFYGMEHGSFTGVGLGKYFNGPAIEDPYNARRIINGLDHAQDIANIYQMFKLAL